MTEILFPCPHCGQQIQSWIKKGERATPKTEPEMIDAPVGSIQKKRSKNNNQIFYDVEVDGKHYYAWRGNVTAIDNLQVNPGDILKFEYKPGKFKNITRVIAKQPGTGQTSVEFEDASDIEEPVE